MNQDVPQPLCPQQDLLQKNDKVHDYDCLDGPKDNGWYLVQPCELGENGGKCHAGQCWFTQKDDESDICMSFSCNLDSKWLPAKDDGEIGGGQAPVGEAQMRPFSVDESGDWLKKLVEEEGEIASREMIINFSGFEYRPDLLPLSLVDIRYPRGVIAWGKDSNFTVCS